MQTQIHQDSLNIDVTQRDKVRLTFSDGRTEETPVPEHVREFMDRFDSGAYPELYMPWGTARP
jgi:hypothetical protein